MGVSGLNVHKSDHARTGVTVGPSARGQSTSNPNANDSECEQVSMRTDEGRRGEGKRKTRQREVEASRE